MATINVTNERRMMDVSAQGEQVSIKGVITVDCTGCVDSMSGNIYHKDGASGEIIIGNYSLTNINMHAEKYAAYRTESSQLIDESAAYAESLYTADSQEGGVA